MSADGVRAVCFEQCEPTGWKGQFMLPRGRAGALVGRLMAIKNAAMNRFAVETLDIQLGDHVLEIGFAHGRAVRRAAQIASKGVVAGIDLSATMVDQARNLNGEGVRAGRVELIQGSVSDLPYDEGRFDKVFAVNNFQFWPRPLEDLAGVRRVMGPGGTFLACASSDARSSASWARASRSSPARRRRRGPCRRAGGSRPSAPRPR